MTRAQRLRLIRRHRVIRRRKAEGGYTSRAELNATMWGRGQRLDAYQVTWCDDSRRQHRAEAARGGRR